MKSYALIILLIFLISCKEKFEYQPVVCPALSDEDVAYWIPFHLNDTLTFINDSNPDTMRLIINNYKNWAGEGRCGGCEAVRQMSTTIDPEYRIAFSFLVYQTSDYTSYVFHIARFDEDVAEFDSDSTSIDESFAIADSLDHTSGFIEPTEVNGIVYENSIHMIPRYLPPDWLYQVYLVPYLGFVKFRDSQTEIVWERVM